MQFRKLFFAGLTAFIVLLTFPTYAWATALEDSDELGILIDKLEQQEILSSKEEAHVGYIVSRYGVQEQTAKQFIAFAKKYADPVFPQYEDILAVTEVESKFNPKAKSKGNCAGLMQLKYAYHRAGLRSVKELFQPETNMRIGSAYLRELFSQTKAKAGALMSYNTGYGSYRKGNHNRKYLTKVTAARKNFI